MKEEKRDGEGLMNVEALYGGRGEEREARVERGENEEDGKEGAGSDEDPPEVKSVDELVAEAEQRGYLRGLNEAAAAEMAKPGMWQPSGMADEGATRKAGDDDPVGRFLSHRRRSVFGL